MQDNGRAGFFNRQRARTCVTVPGGTKPVHLDNGEVPAAIAAVLSRAFRLTVALNVNKITATENCVWELRRMPGHASLSWSGMRPIVERVLRDQGHDPQKLVFTAHIQSPDPARVGEPLGVDWWEAPHLLKRHADVHERAWEAVQPEYALTRIFDPFPRPMVDTAFWLADFRHDTDQTLAILTLAKLFEAEGDPVRRVPPFGVSPEVQARSTKAVLDGLASGGRTPWAGNAKYLLPRVDDERVDTVAKRKTVESVIEAAAYRLAATLDAWTPIYLELSAAKPAHLYHELHRRRIKQAEYSNKLKRVERENIQRKARAEATRVIRRKQGVRASEWPNKISTTELTSLVWSHPISRLNETFAVSDQAIRKECRKRGIPIPGRGFWAKVNAGKLSHPNGVPRHEYAA